VLINEKACFANSAKRNNVRQAFELDLACDARLGLPNVSGYINGLRDGKGFRHATYALAHTSRKAALDQFLAQAKHGVSEYSNEIMAI
jgi:hypothetical protein